MFNKARYLGGAAALALALFSMGSAARADIVASDRIGGGGGFVLGAPCPQFSPWLTGLRLNWGSWVEGLQTYCGTAFTGDAHGDFGGPTTEDRVCPPGHVVTGIAAHFGDFLDGGHLLCTDLRDVIRGFSPQVTLDHFGGPGGPQSAYFQCPQHKAVTALAVGSNVYVDSIRLYCKTVE
jgi:hypothetical protein